MISGTVARFDTERGFGFIRSDESGTEYFVHRSAIEGGGFRHLVPNEPVEFETKYNSSKDREEVSVVRAPHYRQSGTVRSFDHNKGFGFIRPDDGSPDVFMHYSEILKTQGKPTAIDGERVQFEVDKNDKGPRATRIKRLDTRLPLFRFASLGNEDRWLKALAQKAEWELWDYRATHEADWTRPILKSYLIYTFARLQDEDSDERKRGTKIAYGSSASQRFACFNTGLVTNNQEQIYALFAAKSPSNDGCEWKLEGDGFYAESDRQMLGKFERLPELADYFDDPSVLLYDRRCELYIDMDHIIDERIERFPSGVAGNKYLARQLLESARRQTEQRVYRNYKTAIPQFYRGSVQLLLPLCLERPNKADLALVVERHGQQYRGSTALNLDMAYNNARLLSRPDSEWLQP